MNIKFKINAKDEDNYYIVNECTFSKDDFDSAFYEIIEITTLTLSARFYLKSGR
jgi:hypothetical protein